MQSFQTVELFSDTSAALKVLIKNTFGLGNSALAFSGIG